MNRKLPFLMIFLGCWLCASSSIFAQSVGPVCGIGVVLIDPDSHVAHDAPWGQAIIKDHLLITEVILGGPAGRAGLVHGDEIFDINGKPVAGLSFKKACALLRGQPGTMVQIALKHAGQSRPMPLTFTRESIHLHQ